MTPTETLVRLAQEIAEYDPILAFELEKNASAGNHTAVVNPGVKKFEDHVEEMVAVLKSLKQELEGGLETLDTTDAKEFAKFFTDVVDAEEEQLRSALQKTKALKTAARLAASRTAGPLDFVKNIFKKKPSKSTPDDSDVNTPSYTMDDKSMDDFVDGSGDWAEASKYIEKEFQENKDFFNGVNGILTQVDRIRKNPSKPLVESLVEAIGKLIQKGDGFIKNIRQSLKSSPKIEITEEGMDPKHPLKKSGPADLEWTVDHYIDMLRESLGDESKTIKNLKELFSAVGPLVEDDRATLASQKILPVLVRTAHAIPTARPVLIPIIRRIVSVSSLSKK